jgi:hypothetical protein
MIEAIRLESPGQSTHTVGARQQPCSCRRGTRGDKRPHVGLPILQDGEQKSLVGKGSHAMPAANVLWACIQDPNHRAWLSRSHGGHGDGDPAMAPTRTTASPLGFSLPMFSRPWMEADLWF